MPNDKNIELTNEEEMVIIFIRKYGPYADFTIEKRPSSESVDGKITRIITTQSSIVEKLLGSFV